jgi:hypothetical protein
MESEAGNAERENALRRPKGLRFVTNRLALGQTGSIKRVADNRVMNGLQMHSDLMGAAGLSGLTLSSAQLSALQAPHSA